MKAFLYGWLVLTGVTFVLCSAWALQKPRLEVVWALDAELQSGLRSELSSDERSLVQETLDAHAELARALREEPLGLWGPTSLDPTRQGSLEGRRSYLIRARTNERRLCVRPRARRKDRRVFAEVRAQKKHAALELSEDGRCFDFSASQTPELVELRYWRLSKKGNKKQARVDISWESTAP